MKKKTAKEKESAGEAVIEDPLEALIELFESCLIEADWSDLTKNFMKLYESHADEFESYLDKFLMLTLKEVKRSTAISKIFRFLSECLVALDNLCKGKSKDENNEDDEEVEEETHPLLLYALKSLKKYSESASYIIRFRSCQLLYAILSHMIDKGVGELDANVYQSIANLALKRRLDVSATVRAHAVQLAKFFQDPTDHEDPVIAVLQYQMERDPNARVRQNIVEVIAVCEETIDPVYKRFLYDKNAQVRNSALLHISMRTTPRAFTTLQRIRILNNCFRDPSAAVRKNAVQKLIPMWLRAYNDEVLVFFQNLRRKDKTIEELPFADDLLLAIVKCVKLSHLIKEIKLNDESFLPSTLSPEKIYLWHRIFNLSQREKAVKKIFPESEKLVDYFIQQLRNYAVEKNQTVIFKELIMFLTDVIKVVEKEKCDRIMSTLLDIIKNPFVPNMVVRDSVFLYFEHAASEEDLVFDDLILIIMELLKLANFMTGKEQAQIILKCLSILTEILNSPYVVKPTENITELKDLLILPHLKSDEDDIKTEAYKALSLYCLLDFEEAKEMWTCLSSGLHSESSGVKMVSLEGSFDLLFSYGGRIFADTPEECDEILNSFLKNLVLNIEADSYQRDIIARGILKLFLARRTFSPEVLFEIIKLIFHPSKYYEIANDVDCFLTQYPKSRDEIECVTGAFIAVIKFLFDCSRSSGYYKVNIKSAALKLLEYAAIYEESKQVTVQEKFKDLLVVELIKNFIRKPSRLQITDLQSICCQIVPRDIDKLAKLKRNVKIIIEDLHYQKNPYSKKSIKFFTAYLKSIQDAIEATDDSAVKAKDKSRSDDEAEIENDESS